MTELFLKEFVKNYKDVNNPEVRKQYGILGAVFGVVTNLVLFISKLVVGILIFNISIIADALNNLSDFGSCFINIFGFKMSARPADKRHPFGHQRMEYIISLIVSVIIISLGLSIGSEAVQTFIHPGEAPTEIIVPACILGASILVKILQGCFYFSLGKRIDSIALKASGADSRNDVISTVGVLAGLLISYYTGFVYIDGIIAILVALFVIVSGVKFLIDTADLLLGKRPDQELVDKFVEIVKSNPVVLGIHDIEMHSYGPSQIFASCHAEVNSKDNVLEIHDHIDNIEREVYEKIGVKTVIHMDPVVVGDPLLEHYKECVRECLAEVNDKLHFHDFRMVKGPTHTNLVFDIVVPFDLSNKKESILKCLNERVHAKEDNVYLVVTFDDEYTTISSSEDKDKE